MEGKEGGKSQQFITEQLTRYRVMTLRSECHRGPFLIERMAGMCSAQRHLASLCACFASLFCLAILFDCFESLYSHLCFSLWLFFFFIFCCHFPSFWGFICISLLSFFISVTILHLFLAVLQLFVVILHLFLAVLSLFVVILCLFFGCLRLMVLV